MPISDNVLKIVFFSHTAKLTGAERSMLGLINELIPLGVNPHLVLPSHGPLEAVLKQNEIAYDIVNLNWWADPTIKEKAKIITERTQSVYNLAHYFPKISSLNPDLIYSNTIASPWGAITANYLQKPHIWHIREFGDLDHNLIFDAPYSEIISFIENNSDKVIANSQAVAKHISQFMVHSKPEIVYGFIQLNNKLVNKKVQNPFKNKGSLKILVCGSINKGKNQFDAIRATKRLLNQGHYVELLLLGDMSDIKYVEKINQYIIDNNLGQHIHLKNFVKNPYPYYRLSDVVVVTSKKEAYGRTAIEAMILKKPVVTTILGGNKEIIQNKINGFTYQVGNIEQLTRLLSKLSDKNLQKSVGLMGYHSLDQINNRQRYGKKVYDMIRSTLRSYHPKENLLNIFINTFLQINSKDDIEQQIQIQNKLDELKIIKSSEFYKLWPIYQKIKKIFKNDH